MSRAECGGCVNEVRTSQGGRPWDWEHVEDGTPECGWLPASLEDAVAAFLAAENRDFPGDTYGTTIDAMREFYRARAGLATS